MLIVTGLVEIAVENMEAAEKAIQSMVRETQQETGCITYEICAVVGAKGRFRVYEEWQDQAALEAHFESPHMAEFRATLGDIGVLSSNIYKIEDAEKVPLR